MRLCMNMSEIRQLSLALERGLRWMLHIDSDEVRAWLEGWSSYTCGGEFSPYWEAFSLTVG